MLKHADVAGLRKLRDLLSEPERWTKRVYARTASGAPTGARSPDAKSWCLAGACMKVTGTNCGRPYEFLRALVPPMALCELNDDPKTTHEDIMELLDWAYGIAQAEEEK